MRYTTIFIICCLVALLGAVLLAFQQEWLIIRMPQTKLAAAPSCTVTKIKKTVTLHFWHDNGWHTEKQDILSSSDHADNLFCVVTSWLNTLDAEEISSKKIILQDATLSPSQTDAYLSFDRNPFQQKWSVYEKWMWIEGLINTIRDQQLPIQNIYLLVNHKPLIDRHIDAVHPWPISGFLLLNETHQKEYISPLPVELFKE